MSVRNSFRLIVAIAALGLLCLAGFWLGSEHNRLVYEKRQQLAYEVEVAHSVLAHFQRLEAMHEIDRETAQGAALRIIRDMRYAGSNYFWINDLHHRMIMHPTQPALEGTIRPDSFMTDMLREVERNGSGFVEYQFARPGRPATETGPKLSFVRGFGPWGWVIGTGIYIDDVDAAWRGNALHAAVVAFACLAVLFTVSTVAFRSLFRQLNQVVQQMHKVAMCRGHSIGLGSLRLPPPADHDDRETAVLIRGLNEMLDQIEQRDGEIAKHHETLECSVAERTAELRASNARLEVARSDTELLLESIPSLLIGLDAEGRITRWNAAAARTFGITTEVVIGRVLDDCGITWIHPDVCSELLQWFHTDKLRRCDDIAYELDGRVRFLGLSVRPVVTARGLVASFLVTGADITERKCLEEQLRQAQKLEAVGQLAAGVAHEINTPTQYVADNTQFIGDSWGAFQQLLELCRNLREEAAIEGSISVASLARFDEISSECELDYLEAEIPSAINASLEGLARIAKIVRAMKEFAHPGGEEKRLTDINRAIESTIVLCCGEWKYVAEVTTDLDERLPQVPCFVNEFNQVILNLIVNSAQAIGEAPNNPGRKGEIQITTRHTDSCVTVSVRDTGPGIPDEIRARVFEPFFTTKAVGKGTGQGLALAHSVIVKKHQGRIWFETKRGEGTTFFIELPSR